MIERTPYGACPLCLSSVYRIERDGDCSRHRLHQPSIPKAIRWLRCPDCQHVYTDGYFDTQALATILELAHESQVPGRVVETQRAQAAEIVEWVEPFLPGRNRTWLDVGCGSGALLMVAAEYGFEPFGLDLRPSVVSALRALSIGAATSTIEQSPEVPFGVVSMADVLEHMPFPAQALEAARARLSDSGLLFVSCPAAESPMWRLLGAENPYWNEIEHFQNFSRERLEKLLTDTGFEPIAYRASRRYRLGMEILARKTHASP